MTKYILGIETSCDETSIAIIKNGIKPVCEATSSQVKLMAKYGGVVPELSARKHLEALPILFKECKKQAPNAFNKVSIIAVTSYPGLPPALATGLAYAYGLALGMNLPVIEVDHLHAHLCSILIKDTEVIFPHISLLVSGGHTSLFFVESPVKYTLLGKTKDDAAGEAFDKVARMLGLGYPGGPAIQKWAEKAEKSSTAFSVPIPDDPYNFSFSGLKTAVRRLIVELAQGKGINVPKDVEIEKLGSALPESTKQQIAYGFQETVVESLVQKTIQAAGNKGVKMVALTGGVAANKRLRQRLTKETQKVGLKLKYPEIKLCTDNALMVACAGYFAGKAKKMI